MGHVAAVRSFGCVAPHVRSCRSRVWFYVVHDESAGHDLLVVYDNKYDDHHDNNHDDDDGAAPAAPAAP